MERKERLSTSKKKKSFVEMYGKKGCNAAATCLSININRKTFYLWLEKDTKFKEQIEEIQDAILDGAESKLLQHINDGDTTCLIFFLKTKGKGRGYVERFEQDVTVNPFLELMKSASQVDGE